MRIASVNVGQPRLNPWKTMKLTGIDKRPVEGPVMVTRPRAKGMGLVGLAGDRVYDVLNHGGPDQAVYAYAREDLDFWVAELGRPLPNRVFGENLTTKGIDVNNALIGEHWRIGPDVILEVSCPRIPCGTFQGWLAQAAARRRRPAGGTEGSGPPPYRLGPADEPDRPGQESVRGLAGVEPADPGVTAEPGFLAAGEPPGGLHRL
jgi:MOSC domain-containing protein YiiM